MPANQNHPVRTSSVFKSAVNVFKQNKGFILFIALMLIFRSAIADWNHVPTGSMKPTIIEGDYILIDKLAYDLKVPFVNYSLLELDQPKAGDIIVFESAAADKRLVKRVIGVPGDTIAMRDNKLTINGEDIGYELTPKKNTVEKTALYLQENLPQKTHAIRLDFPIVTGASSFAAIEVPSDHYFVLGDNRNNSADSRYIGFVPKGEIVGRAKRVLASLDYDDYFLPRGNRINQPLQ